MKLGMTKPWHEKSGQPASQSVLLLISIQLSPLLPPLESPIERYEGVAIGLNVQNRNRRTLVYKRIDAKLMPIVSGRLHESKPACAIVSSLS